MKKTIEELVEMNPEEIRKYLKEGKDVFNAYLDKEAERERRSWERREHTFYLII